MTRTLRVGPVVTNVVSRHAVVVSGALSTMQALTGGRAVGVVGTGNSTARGLDLHPSTLGELEDAVALMRGHWRGEGGRYRGSQIPGTGAPRPSAPLFVAGDGPRAVALAGRIGDGVVYSGSLADEVLTRRIAAARAGGDPRREFWIVCPVSVGTSLDAVRDELGAALIAIANRALRGDLEERGVPAELRDDVERMWTRYDYGSHGTFERPRNVELLTPPLAAYLIENFCVWGGEGRWATLLRRLADRGCSGVIFVVNQRDELATSRAVCERLGRLEPDGSRLSAEQRPTMLNER